MTIGQSVIDNLSDECHRIVNMLDDLRRDYAMKFEIGRHLLDATRKHLGLRMARDRCNLRREFSSRTVIEECPGFIQQISGATTDFQKFATGKSSFVQIQKKLTESRPESRFLEPITCIAVTRRATFVIRWVEINLLDRIGSEPRIQIVQSAFGASYDRVWLLKMKSSVALLTTTLWAHGIFEV